VGVGREFGRPLYRGAALSVKLPIPLRKHLRMSVWDQLPRPSGVEDLLDVMKAILLQDVPPCTASSKVRHSTSMVAQDTSIPRRRPKLQATAACRIRRSAEVPKKCQIEPRPSRRMEAALPSPRYCLRLARHDFGRGPVRPGRRS
jgi:hypothetical protein